MSDIYVPIDYSSLKSIIPSGEEILYSTLCNVRMMLSQGPKTIHYKWKTHVLITPNGIAYFMPDTLNRKAPLLAKYSTWDEIYRIFSMGKIGYGFSLRKAFDFKLIRDGVFETKEKFNERSKEFVAKFRPLLIKKKEEWLELYQNNPVYPIKKKRINKIKKSLAMNKQKEEKRRKKELKQKKN